MYATILIEIYICRYSMYVMRSDQLFKLINFVLKGGLCDMRGKIEASTIDISLTHHPMAAH